MRIKILSLLVSLISLVSINAQQYPGTVFYGLQGNTSATFKDTSGTTVLSLTGLTGTTGYSVHMMPGGNIWRSVNATGNLISGGGVYGRIQKINLNKTILWDWTYTSSTYVLHHDFCPLPNGNVLLICYDVHTVAEMAAVGISSGVNVQFEKIIEVKPTGPTTGTIVWEWRIWDHLCQTSNSSLSNYVTSAVNNPQLLSMSNVTVSKDFIHANGIDYNEELDQIVFSSHFLHEWYIIDHSTTTAEAATHSGGISGKGGDFLYRWGNPANYGATGTKIFNVLHDAHWVPKGYPREGSIVAINNGGLSGPNQSTIDWAKPTLNGYLYSYTPGTALPPSTFDKRLLTGAYTSNEGGSVQFPNGNTQVTLAFAGTLQIKEFDSTGTKLWEYTSGQIAQSDRFTTCEMDTNSVRAYFDTFTYMKCPGGSPITLTAKTIKGNGTNTYQWSSYPANGSYGTNASINVNPTSTTTYTVTVTSNSCTFSASAIVRINTPSVDAGNNIAIPAGSSALLKATGASTYVWSNGKTSDTTTVNPMATTTYYVTGTNSYGCTAIDSVVVTVVPKIVIALSASPTKQCNKDSSTIIANVSGGNGTYTFKWTSIPIGFNSTSQNIKVAPSTTTNYKLVVSSGGIKDSAIIIDTILALPPVDAGFNLTILNGQSAFLKATGAASYIWSNGKNTDTNTVFPTTTTKYYVTGTGANSCVSNDSITITVLPAFITSISANPNPICIGDSVQLGSTASGAIGTYTYAWSSTPAGFTSTIKNPKVKVNANTTYRLITTSGSFKDTQYIPVTVIALPIADAGLDATINYGQSSLLTATGGTSYAWSNGANTDTTTVSPIFTTKYFVTVSANGCSAKDSVKITVNNAPLVIGNILSSLDTICQGDSIKLDINPNGATYSYSYKWTSTSSSFNSIIKNPADLPNATTTYKVVITSGIYKDSATKIIVVKTKPIANAGLDRTITFGDSTLLKASGGSSYQWSNGILKDSNLVKPMGSTIYSVTVFKNGCSDSSKVKVTVDTPAIVASISVLKDSICLGDSIQLNTSVSGGTNTYSYAWSSMPSGFSSILKNPVDKPIGPIIYNVNITSGAKSISKNIQIKVIPKPATPTISKTGNSLISSNPTGNNWFKDTSKIANAINQSYSPTSNGNYFVQTTNFFGCQSNKSAVFVFVLSAIPNLSKEEFEIYPNPFDGILNMRGSLLDNNYQVEVLNLSGQILFKSENTKTLDLSNFANGVYTLRILTPNQFEIKQQVVLSK